MQIYYLKADWLTQQEQLKSLRHQVFVVEQKVPVEIEQDGKDDTAKHFIALNEAGQLLGCGRLLPNRQIGRLAVLPEQRNQGVGRKLLDTIIEDAIAQGYRDVFLLAQAQATQFYIRAGFVSEGPQFLEAGIPHQRMKLLLPVEFEEDEALRGQPLMNPLPVKFETRKSEPVIFNSESVGRNKLYDLIPSATRTICIYSQFFDPAMFDNTVCETLLSAFSRSGRESRVRVLIHDSVTMVQSGHRLQALAHRLSGYFEIRRVQPEYRLSSPTFVVFDRYGIWVLPDYEDYNGYADPYHPVEAERLLQKFERCWEHSQPDPELRILDI